MRILRMLTTALIVSCLIQSAAQAGVMFGFSKITNNGNPDVASQLSVEVGSYGVGTGPSNVDQVYFKFFNIGSIASSIADVYFDDGTLLSLDGSLITSSSGVSFSPGAAPGNLPGGNAISFHTTTGFSADSDAPVAPNGVNPGEWLQIVINLKPTFNLASTLSLLNNSALPGNYGIDVEPGLRIGLHVQSIGTKRGSDSYVNGGTVLPPPAPPGPSVVPEPTSGLIFLLLGTTGLVRSRYRSRLA